MKNIKEQFDFVFKEHIVKRRAMFIPIACVSTFMLVGYAAVDKEKPTIVTDRIELSYGEKLDLDTLVITDNRSDRESIEVLVNTDSLDNMQLGRYNIEVTATDAFSNQTKKMVEVEVVDQVGPQFEVLGANDGYFIQVPVKGSNEITSYVKAVDNVDGDVTAFIEASDELDTNTIGFKTIELTATDSSGNTTEQSYIFAISDTEAPVINLVQGNDIVVDYGSTFNIDEYASIADNLDENVEVSVDGTIDTLKEETQTIKITAKDKAGNTSEETLKANVKDISGPVISLSTSSVKVRQNESFDAKSYLVSAIDAKDGDVSANVQVSSIDTSSGGKKTVTYTVTDSLGNTSTVSLEVTVDTGANDSVAAAALAQLGVNQDCTALVTNALRAIGVYHHGWPASYMSLGHIVSYADALPGDIVYYANGGTGVAHVAIYIGNGQAVHGGWRGTTVKYSVTYSNCSTPIFIRVDR